MDEASAEVQRIFESIIHVQFVRLASSVYMNSWVCFRFGFVCLVVNAARGVLLNTVATAAVDIVYFCIMNIKFLFGYLQRMIKRV